MIGGIAQVKIVLISRGKFPDSSGRKPVIRNPNARLSIDWYDFFPGIVSVLRVSAANHFARNYRIPTVNTTTSGMGLPSLSFVGSTHH